MKLGTVKYCMTHYSKGMFTNDYSFNVKYLYTYSYAFSNIKYTLSKGMLSAFVKMNTSIYVHENVMEGRGYT